jgi:hypothetical protein
MDYLYRVVVGTTKNEHHMQENLESRNLNKDSVVICLFYKAVSPELFRFKSMLILKLYWHFPQGL